MEDLPLLDQEILTSLKKIERCIDSAELSYPQNINKQKFIEIIIPDNRPKLERTLFAHMMEQYLLRNDIDFESTYDLTEDKSKDYMKLGIIKGENIHDIKEKVTGLKNKLLRQDNHNGQISIVLDTNKDSLIINLISISVPKETVERSILNILIDKNTEVSWDEIVKNDDNYNKAENKVLIKRVSDASRRLNNKIVKKTELKEKLIQQRRNNYSLTRKVTKK